MGDNLFDIGQGSASLYQFFQVYCNRRSDILESERLAKRLASRTDDLPVYSRLKEGEIRLLILEPGTQESLVRCKLCTCSQTDKIPYQALSYTWGDPTKVLSIDCNGENMQIASNLHQALLHLRHPRRTRILWIDALCINQGDFKERGQQVQLMRTIYAGARQVVAWLGEGTQESLNAFAYLSKDPRSNRGGLLSNEPWESIGLDFIIEPHKTDHYKEDLLCLTKLLERPWFRRLWVLQEVVHGENVIVMAGNETVSWGLLAKSVQKLYRSGLILGKSSEKAQAGAAAVIEMESIRRSRPGLLSVLLATNSGECSDARDRLYAVLNLANDYDSKRDIGTFGPDYSLEPKEIFTRFARWCVERGNIDFLSCTTRAEVNMKEELQLPSWVPDWTNIDNDHPFARYLDRVPFRADIGLEELPHSQPRITEDNELVLFGAIVGVIEHVGPSSTFKKSNMDAEAKELVNTALANQRWLEECRNIGGRIQNSSQKQFWRTVTATLTGAGYAVSEDFGRRFHKYLQMLDEISVSVGPKQHISSSVFTSFASQKYLIASIESTILMWTSKRRFAVTEQGMMALVPSSTKPGDVVAVMAGSKVPLVFREVPYAAGKYHKVLGEAFVDDLMDGRFVMGHVEDYKRLGKGHNRPLFKYFLLT
ncbi:related to heterokaryon incompatibility protein [Fusarium torulosum]|uniref:Related to heterokaryon incompatibility protein n=1 Tax=Fusarium torulosum TaxID=33205 RepID=A0AAE8MGY0_9HYPO|nr:related to heterokaryon incompatibility protein [Fusarium torulosum]